MLGNHPEGEFFLFSRAAARAALASPDRNMRSRAVEKLGRLIGQSPGLTCRGPGTQPASQYAKKKKYESLLAEVRGAYEWMTERERCLPGRGKRINGVVKEQSPGRGWNVSLRTSAGFAPALPGEAPASSAALHRYR
ncbi:hypothetical protein KM043_015545 [Ampulex compressa]|nr:hypothetical protein KM043_015545 [Ampulex compressa]